MKEGFLVYPPKSHFMDSGAFSLRKFTKGEIDYSSYIKEYAKFLKENKEGIDCYVNVDVIDDPEASWEHQQILEGEYGLYPVPVIHYGSSFKWLDHYIDRGYNYLCIGGIAGLSLTIQGPWLDDCFNILCNTRDRLPVVKTHGLGVGGLKVMVKYPWYSLDTARWVHLGGRAYIPIPVRRRGEFVFDENPIIVRAGNNPRVMLNHVKKLGPAMCEAVERWLEKIGLSIDLLFERPENWHASYLLFFEELRNNIPRFPWPMKPINRGFKKQMRFWEESHLPKKCNLQMKIYYSGQGGPDRAPEAILKREANIMLSFWDMPCRRFSRILKARRSGRPILCRRKDARRRK